MAGEASLTTVYRSADANAETDAAAVKNLLIKAGLNPVLVDDTISGVVSGTWEVRVPAEEVSYAEEMIEQIDQEEPGSPDPSAAYDLVPVAATEGVLSEMEAISIKTILDASGINAVIVGTSQLPNLGFEVQVAETDAERARQTIAEAQAAGPAGAVEAESATEPPDQKGV
jgi:hypothetical protein